MDHQNYSNVLRIMQNGQIHQMHSCVHWMVSLRMGSKHKLCSPRVVDCHRIVTFKVLSEAQSYNILSEEIQTSGSRNGNQKKKNAYRTGYSRLTGGL